MTQNNQLATRADRIGAKIDQGIVAGIGMSPQRGMQVETMGQAMEVAKLMSLSGCAVPPHLRENPGACLAIAIQSYEWSINPFALANKSYSVSDRLAYEAALYSAVIQRRAPIKGRIKYEYAGEGMTRTCTVSAELSDGSGWVSYTSPKFSTIQPKNSPLWKNDPDQQMAYYSVRAFARRHFSDTMMGIATVDELIDSPPPSVPVVSMVPGESRVESLTRKVTSRPLSDGQTLEPMPEAAQEAEQAEAGKAHSMSGKRPVNGKVDLPGQEIPLPATQTPSSPAPADDTTDPAGVDADHAQAAPAAEPIQVYEPADLTSHGKLVGALTDAIDRLGADEPMAVKWIEIRLGDAMNNERKQKAMTGRERHVIFAEFVKAFGGVVVKRPVPLENP